MAAKIAPFCLLYIGLYGLVLAGYLVPPGEDWLVYGPTGPGTSLGLDHLLLPEALLIVAAGLWLLVRTDAPGAGLVRALPGQL